jgi:hypothetical protein
VNTPAERSGDAATPESIIRIAYEMISGRAGVLRDWDRWRALHAPGARLIPIEAAADGSRIARVMTPEEFITSRSAFFADHHFYEWETDRQALQYGRLVHVWSSYEAAEEPDGPRIRKGVNSFQLWDDGARWWILSVSWDAVEALEVSNS